MVRLDLPLPQQTVQACHAVLEHARHFTSTQEHPYVIVLGVPNELAIERIKDKLDSEQIPNILFREPDLGGKITSVAAGPVYGSARKFFRHFKLLKGE